ncbi:Enoyl-CoA hydratase/isomerase [uncultured Mycobacterium sp.]|uniref:Enoyl-CoA hydratase/isomerase n=1 Tax=uncultured Mycobacterium sp. TaxID=171292 RepID=A0A1Y5PQR6_9MYCO|nr:Enoyl-CoA hydratase/isomerase [uncultured Mycobacterium sp.]
MSDIRIDDVGAVRHVIISRVAKRNALSSHVYGELGQAFAEAAANADVLCVVLRGDGPIFSAGNDVRELAGLATDPGAVRRGRPIMLSAVNALEEMAKPTIAQIHGACIGGAAELALACDLRVMADDAQIAWLETKLGLIPDLGGSSRLPAIVGLGRAKELVLTARPVGADEALRIGLVNRVAPADRLADLTADLVEELLTNGHNAIGLAKRLLDAAAKPALALTLEMEVTAQDTLVRTDDFEQRLDAATTPIG